MFPYIWYRYLYFPQLFVKDNRVDDFAEVYMSSNLEAMKDKGDKIRERVRSTRSNRMKWSAVRDALLRDGRLLQDEDFHTVASKYHRLVLILSLIFLAESGLNYFTALIAIPAAGGLSGAFGTILRVAAAVVVTVVGIVGAEVFFDEVLPSEKYGKDAEERRHARNWARAMLWGALLLGTEFMIYHFGLLRVRDIGAGKTDPDIAYSIVVLSMIVPVIAGGIAWEVGNIHDAYKNRLKCDRLAHRIDRADTHIETLNEQENSYVQRETNAYWRTFIKLKGFKEYYNHKRQAETAPLSAERAYAASYETFYGEALLRYNQHKEKQDALGRALKLDAGNYGIVGRKIGQDNA